MKYKNSMLAVAKISFTDIMSYKMNIVSIIVSHMLNLFLNLFLWKVILEENVNLKGYTIENMFIYMSLAVVLNSFFNTPRRLAMNISHDILDGTIVNKLLYPMDYYDYYWCYCIGRGTFFLFFVSVPLMLMSAILFCDFYMPSLFKVVFFIISTILGYFIETGMALIISGMLFWTEKASGIISVASFLAFFFSGRLIPIDFFPNWLKNIANVLPYKYAIYTPISVYLERINPKNQIAMQIMWIVILVIIGRKLFKHAYSKVEVAGG